MYILLRRIFFMRRLAMKDLIIVGSGPAGLSAALTAKRRNLDWNIVNLQEL